MENLSIKNFIIERCKIGKRDKWKNLYSDIANEIYENFGQVIGTEQIRYISKKYRQDNNLDENFNPIKILEDSILDGEDSILFDNGFNPKDFSLVNYKTSSWTGVDGKEYVSRKVSIRPRNEFIWTKDYMEKLLSEINYVPPIENHIDYNNDSNSILVLPIVDFHYMRFSNKNFTNENYDCGIAKKNFYHIINSTISKYSKMGLKKIIFVIGNDMINCDNMEGTTTKGTKQENCSNIEQAIIEVSNLLVSAINQLKTLAKVDVIYVPSNHDYLVSFGIANALRLRYSNDPNVNVDSAYKERKYRQEGTCLLGFAHDIKVDNVNTLIMNDAKEYISDTNRRIYFLGHLHHEQFKDVGGTEVRRMSSIAGQSRWEYNKGYTGIRKCQTFLINPKNGIEEIHYIYMD